MEYKATTTEFKANGDKGEYEGHFAVFGNVDDGADVSHEGMFVKTIAERGKRIKVFYAHDWDKLIGPPPASLKEDSLGLFASGRLTLDSFWGSEAWALMKDGALTEGSFGYEAVKFDFESIAQKTIRHLREVKLFEISPVPLGMNPLTELRAIKAFLDGKPVGELLADELRARLPSVKGAIAPHTTPKADEGTAWDAGAAVREAEGAQQLRRMHAWMDPDGEPDSKSTYKLPHHLPDGKVVWRGCAAAGAVMMGGRGGASIPAADVDGVKRHLAGHYRQFDKTPPWEEEAGLDAHIEIVEAIARDFVSLKVGRVLSAANVEKARSALAALQGALESLNQLIAAAEPEPDKAHSALLRQRVRAAQAALSLIYS